MILLAQTLFIFYAVKKAPKVPVDTAETVGKTLSIGQSMYTEYLLPVEIVGVLLLMAIIGGVVLARRIEPENQFHLVSAGTGNLGDTEKIESDTAKAEN